MFLLEDLIQAIEEVESLRAELKKTKDKLDNALSEVAVAQVLQENLCSVERQKVQ